MAIGSDKVSEEEKRERSCLIYLALDRKAATISTSLVSRLRHAGSFLLYSFQELNG